MPTIKPESANYPHYEGFPVAKSSTVGTHITAGPGSSFPDDGQAMSDAHSAFASVERGSTHSSSAFNPLVPHGTGSHAYSGTPQGSPHVHVPGSGSGAGSVRRIYGYGATESVISSYVASETTVPPVQPP